MPPGKAPKHDWFVAAALTLRDRVVRRWLQSERRQGLNTPLIERLGDIR